MSKLTSAFVSGNPEKMFEFLSANAASVVENLAKNMKYLGTCDVVRFLLDVPLVGKVWRACLT